MLSLPLLGEYPNKVQGVQLVEKDQKGLKYSAPKLTVYGDMADLTAAGSRGNAENGQTMNPNRRG